MAKVAAKKNAAPKKPKKPKDPNAPKRVKKPKTPTAAEEARERQRLKDVAASAKKMESFVQRPPPKYMTAEQFAQKKELLSEKEELLANVADGQKRLEVLMDPVEIVKLEISRNKSRLNYLGVELREYKGLREPLEATVEERLVNAIKKEEEEKKPAALKEEEGLFVPQD